MMKKILAVLIMALSITALSACAEDYSKVSNVVIIEKSTVQSGRWDYYYIVVEKEGSTLKLETTRSIYDALIEGNTINAVYEKDSFYVTDISLPLIEDESVDKSK